MRIEANYGSDTAMWLVDVFLETAEDLALTDEQIERRAADLLAAQEIDPMNVVDFSTRVKNGQGEWASATRNDDGKLVPVSW